MPDPIQVELANNLHGIQAKIQSAAHACNRSPESITLMAVSKGQPLQRVLTLKALGISDFGENYAQELVEKSSKAPADINWHYIGQLQSNKISRLVEICTSIHTVATLKHAQAIGDAAEKHNKAPFPVYIQVNADLETSKGGLPLEQSLAFYQQLREQIPTIAVQGLMAIPSSDYADKDFVGKPLPASYERLSKTVPKIGKGLLSLGMSSDLGLAIRAGSTTVRIGRALMGERC